MAGAASPSPPHHLDTADEFLFFHPPRALRTEKAPRSRGRSGSRSGSKRHGASRGCSGSRSRSTERALGSSTSQPRCTSRPGHVLSGPIRSRSRNHHL
ncbi:hypothetical protein MRX96_036656 [Rhipicephalus microplus]